MFAGCLSLFLFIFAWLICLDDIRDVFVKGEPLNPFSAVFLAVTTTGFIYIHILTI